jgi:Protein of unknown function (DUF3040)
MLNQNDRRRLEAIERHLQSEDPEFARRFTQWPPAPARRWCSWPVFLLVVSGFGVLLSLAVLSPALLLLSVGGTVAGWVWLLRRNHRNRNDAGPGRDGNDLPW